MLGAVASPIIRARADWSKGGVEAILSARVHPAEVHTVSAAASGIVGRVLVKPGTRVEAGNLLAELTSPELEKRREYFRLRLELLRRKLSAGTNTDSSGLLAELHWTAHEWRMAALEQWQNFRLGDAELACTQAQQYAGWIRDMADRRLASLRELEDAQRAQDHARLRLDSLREREAILRQQMDDSEAQWRLTRLEVEGRLESDTAAIELAQAEAQGALRLIDVQQATLRVLAPRSGTVVDVAVTPHQRVDGGEGLFELVDLTRLNVDVPASVALAKDVRRGARVTVQLPSNPPVVLDARVSEVLPDPDPNQSPFVIRVVVANPAPSRLLLGSAGLVAFRLAGRPDLP
jgi:multidrug efflux pump subunit AcrA (membrane-fusion protein)